MNSKNTPFARTELSAAQTELQKDIEALGAGIDIYCAHATDPAVAAVDIRTVAWYVSHARSLLDRCTGLSLAASSGEFSAVANAIPLPLVNDT